MAFSNGVFSRVYSWATDKVNSIKITASRMDTEMDGMATGLSTCMLKDGTQTLTANIPFSGYKITGYGSTSAANARTDVPSFGQVQDNAAGYIDGAGTANAHTMTPVPAITAYAAGQIWSFKANATNTGAATIAISGLAAIAIQINGRALIGSEIVSGNIICGIIKDASGTKTFQLLNNGDTVAFTPAFTFATPGDLSVTYSTQAGDITRIGTQALVRFLILTSAFTHTTASGNARVTGFPTSRTDGTFGNWSVGLGEWRGITKANYTDVGLLVSSNSAIAFLQMSGSAQAIATLAAADFPTGGSLRLAGSVIIPLP